MAPGSAAVGSLLRQVVHYHLDNASYENALFFAERLAAQEPKSGDAAHLLSLCHLRLGDCRSAYDASKPFGYRGVNLGCAWVFAHACLALDRHKDGILALEKSRALWSQRCSIGKHSATSRASSPDVPAIFCLLGRLHRAYGDKKKAVAYFEDALKKNPFQWDAFTALCDMGVHVRVPNIFKPNEALLQSLDLDMGSPSALLDGRETMAGGGLAENGPDPFSRRHGARTAATDLPAAADPFGLHPASSTTDRCLDAAEEASSSSKTPGVRTRTAGLGSGPSLPGLMEGLETPTGPLVAEVCAPRPGSGQEPPQAPTRRTRNTQALESNLESSPRINYRLGTRRNMRPSGDRAYEPGLEPTSDGPANAATGARTAGTGAVDRKRTLSGHPVARSSASSEEQATRRSARLNMFKPSTRLNSGASTIGASAGRELKKARPPVSRIMRPGSSQSSVGRVVSGNRKPLEDRQGGDGDGGGEATTSTTATATTATTMMTTTTTTTTMMTTAAAGAATGRTKEHTHPSTVGRGAIEEAVRWTLDLTKRLGNGYYLLSRFQCQEALQALAGLPAAQQNTAWVLAQMGRAHYEQAAYGEAEKFFRRVRVLAPSRMRDMELYSTILWHLKRETDLSFLAHELVEAAWEAPQAWCALGNAWSLARDPEQALKCFKRATQLDSKFAYGFSLQGHEHVANEEYERALTAYRQAIAADRRHYNAYYGIGRVQERLGAYDKALDHFRAAQTINPNNAVLICCMGTVLEKQKQMVQALSAYSKAAELAPRAAQTRYKKARALLTVGQAEAAQRELMVLKDLAPEEATVHFLLGTLHKNMGERQLSVRHFTIALSLDPKAAPKIKEAIESLEDEEPDEGRRGGRRPGGEEDDEEEDDDDDGDGGGGEGEEDEDGGGNGEEGGGGMMMRRRRRRRRRLEREDESMMLA